VFKLRKTVAEIQDVLGEVQTHVRSNLEARLGGVESILRKDEIEIGRKLTAEVLLLLRTTQNDLTSIRAAIASLQAQVNTMNPSVPDGDFFKNAHSD
jgi:hypothetical protein